MAKNELGDLRRSQVITTHGPGAILDFRAGAAGVSVVAAGLEQWDERSTAKGLGHAQTIFEPRLQERLKVDGFRLPPVARQIGPGRYAQNVDTLVGVRFPTWLLCPQCHRLRSPRKWGAEPGEPGLYCSFCSGASKRDRVYVLPVRFLIVCPYGHLDEFPWHWWVGHADGCSRKKDLILKGTATAGLAGYILSCTECGEKRPMEGCFGLDALKGMKCAGKRPWLAAEPETCPSNDDDADPRDKPRVLQRGASNLYFSVLESALDIPPWSDALQLRLGSYWSKLASAKDDATLRDRIELFDIPTTLGEPFEKLFTEIKSRIDRLKAPDRNLRFEEYEQLTGHEKAFDKQKEFQIRPSRPPAGLVPWLAHVVQVTRLREVRAISGFTRVLPPLGPEDKRIAAISVGRKNWLPAVEIRGEGIFLELNKKKLAVWEEREKVKTRAAKLNTAYAADWARRGGAGTPPRTITPRLILLHGLAHALIRQLSLECGYNAASLRERLYADVGTWQMAGVLVYTGTPDADGTLGGLVRQGEPGNIARVLQQALTAMIWCSSDPLCIEGVHATTDPLSGAACHACLLAAETSCEEFNRLLDRALLVGTPSEPELGFFRELTHPEDE